MSKSVTAIGQITIKIKGKRTVTQSHIDVRDTLTNILKKQEDITTCNIVQSAKNAVIVSFENESNNAFDQDIIKYVNMVAHHLNTTPDIIKITCAYQEIDPDSTLLHKVETMYQLNQGVVKKQKHQDHHYAYTARNINTLNVAGDIVYDDTDDDLFGLKAAIETLIQMDVSKTHPSVGKLQNQLKQINIEDLVTAYRDNNPIENPDEDDATYIIWSINELHDSSMMEEVIMYSEDLFSDI